MALKQYRKMRKFDRTTEPRGKINRSGKKLRFVVQKHDATRVHFDLRLEIDGVFKSWALPKGPSMNPLDHRLAVRVEDHPIEYGTFEGVIPSGNYGAGTVMVWDNGTYSSRSTDDPKLGLTNLRRGLADGKITIVLAGKKLRGEFALVRLKNKESESNAWLLIKKRDAQAVYKWSVDDEPQSVKTRRSMAQIEASSEARGDVWLPKKGKISKIASKKKIAPPENFRKKKISSRARFPHRLRAMQPVAANPPEKGDWLFEWENGGIRALAGKSGVATHLYSRALLPLEKKYPAVVSALRLIWAKEILLDGEIVAGKLIISDLLFLDGEDLRELPLTERKIRLAALGLASPYFSVSPFVNSLAEAATKAKSLRAKTILAKAASSEYLSGISRQWLRLAIPNIKKVKAPLGGAGKSEAPPLTHLQKIFWPNDGFTKGDLVEYYRAIAPLILPHLRDRPQSLRRLPDGILNEGFFHKDMVGYVPRQVATHKLFSKSKEKTVNYLVCQNLWTLLYMANLGCIELNPWLSRIGSIESPDYSVIDLDPDGNSFSEVVKVALEVKKVLDKIGAQSFCKTSGATGLHIAVPTGARYSFDVARIFAEKVCGEVHRRLPKITSVERNPAKRKGKIYLDFLQNRRSQTLAAPYCVRGMRGAPVSTPLKWSEVKKGLDPAGFTIKTTLTRVKRVGDLWAGILEAKVDLERCLKKLPR